MGWMGTNIKRDDELAHFVRISDGMSVIWLFSVESHLCHASADNLHAVCRSDLVVSDSFDPYPSTVDRSNDLMTCIRCQGLVRRVSRGLAADDERAERVKLALRRPPR